MHVCINYELISLMFVLIGLPTKMSFIFFSKRSSLFNHCLSFTLRPHSRTTLKYLLGSRLPEFLGKPQHLNHILPLSHSFYSIISMTTRFISVTLTYLEPSVMYKE